MVPWSLQMKRRRVSIVYSEYALVQTYSVARTMTTRIYEGGYSKIWRRPSFTRCTETAAVELVWSNMYQMPFEDSPMTSQRYCIRCILIPDWFGLTSFSVHSNRSGSALRIARCEFKTQVPRAFILDNEQIGQQDVLYCRYL